MYLIASGTYYWKVLIATPWKKLWATGTFDIKTNRSVDRSNNSD